MSELTASGDERWDIPLIEFVDSFEVHRRILLGMEVYEVQGSVRHELIQISTVVFSLQNGVKHENKPYAFSQLEGFTQHLSFSSFQDSCDVARSLKTILPFRLNLGSGSGSVFRFMWRVEC